MLCSINDSSLVNNNKETLSSVANAALVEVNSEEQMMESVDLRTKLMQRRRWKVMK